RGASFDHPVEVSVPPRSRGNESEGSLLIRPDSELDHEDVRRKSSQDRVPPLDHQHAVGGPLVHVEVVELVDRSQAIDVDVHDRQEAAPVLTHDDEGRAHHLLLYPETGRQTSDEPRLAGSEAAFEDHHVTGPHLGGEPGRHRHRVGLTWANDAQLHSVACSGTDSGWASLSAASAAREASIASRMSRKSARMDSSTAGFPLRAAAGWKVGIKEAPSHHG